MGKHRPRAPPGGPHAILIAHPEPACRLGDPGGMGWAANAGTGDADSQVRLARAGAADQHQIALTGQKAATGEVADQGFPDWIMGWACW